MSPYLEQVLMTWTSLFPYTSPRWRYVPCITHNVDFHVNFKNSSKQEKQQIDVNALTSIMFLF